MHIKALLMTTAVVALLSGHSVGVAAESATPLYLDSHQPIERRVDDLLARMSLKEKVGQLNAPIPATFLARGNAKPPPSSIEDIKRFAQGTYDDEIGPGGGLFLLGPAFLQSDPFRTAELLNGFQAAALKTRLRIPLLIDAEGTHGVMLPGSTIFPEGLAIGSTWDLKLIKSLYAGDAQEARSMGVHMLSTLVLEPIRDPRLGRNMEGYTEDPFLLSRIGEAIVAGAQSDNVAADDKVVTVFTDFPGQSEPVSGLERGALQISDRGLREVYLPAWRAVIRAGALGVMAGYPEIDSVPTHASAKLLTQILREEMGFDGLVLSEGLGFQTLIYENVAKTQKEAGALALRAGVDLNITYEAAYLGPLLENIAEGRLPASLLDRAVRRVLRQKFRLGLFEHPYVDPRRAAKVAHAAQHQQLALRAAREGIVLLKNERQILPLSKSLKTIAVIGPNADDQANQLGDYCICQFSEVPQHITTVLEGIKAKVSAATKVLYAKGSDVVGDDRSGFADAIIAAKASDVAIVVVGEQGGSSRFTNGKFEQIKAGTDGEGADVASLDLSGAQEDLIKAVQATGTPTVVVLINGRALSTRWVSEHVRALVEAWIPGEKGGDAVADVLFGDYNPSGRLPVTIPRHSGQLPVYYNYQPSKQEREHVGYVDMPSSPLYDFGFGLSFTRFEFTDLRIEPKEIRPGGDVRVTVNVKNIGAREGIETAQLYVHDVIGSVSTPVKQLRGFVRLDLRPGETKVASFILHPHDLALLNQDMHWVVEPGDFEVMVGSSSRDLPLKGHLVVKE